MDNPELNKTCRDYIPDPQEGDEIVQALRQRRGSCKEKVTGPNPVRGAELVLI